MQSRRGFLTQAALTAAVLPVWSAASKAPDWNKAAPEYIPFTTSQQKAGRLDVPEGKRVPFGSDYFSLDSEPDGVLLKAVGTTIRPGSRVSLRLQLAAGLREKVEVEVRLGTSGKKVGHLSIWYPATLQIFEAELDATPAAIMREGVRAVMVDGKSPLFLLMPAVENGSHFLIISDKANSEHDLWSERLFSLRSAQAFGWQEGCVLDGLQELYLRKKDLKALDALSRHLDLYLRTNADLIYENPASMISDNQFNNLESGLPFAVIAAHRPEHRSISLFIDYCRKRIDENGKVKDHFLSTEGCYTVAYPLVVVARQLNQPDLYELALIELEERIQYLSDQKAVYTRAWKDKNQQTYRNWGRGYSWFLLGLVRTGEILQNEPRYQNDRRLLHLKETYQYYTQLALTHQQPDHGWRAYLDLPETAYDCSATAGIGAALAHGQRIGWLPGFTKKQLAQISNRVRRSLTPDGFLKEICQHNAGGEQLQKSGYRVIAQYVLGLLAHIEANK